MFLLDKFLGNDLGVWNIDGQQINIFISSFIKKASNFFQVEEDKPFNRNLFLNTECATFKTLRG